MENEQKYQVYDIKKGRKWQRVRASSMIALNNWAMANGYTYWVLVGMQSREELANNKNLPFVA